MNNSNSSFKNNKINRFIRSSKNTSDVLKKSLKLNYDFLKNIYFFTVTDTNNHDENINYSIIDDKLKKRYIGSKHNILIKNELNTNYQLTERKNIALCGIPEERNELLKKFN